jgi:hypothetical protein
VWREILGENKLRLSFRGKVADQAAEASEVNPARVIGQGRILLAEPANPTGQMRVKAQLREAEHVGKLGLEIHQKAMGGNSIVCIGRDC